MTDHQANLQHAFAFSSEDLTANREGRFTPPQIALMKKYLRNATLALALLMTWLGAIGLISLILAATQNNLPFIGFSIFLLVGLPLLGYWIMRKERDKWVADLSNGLADSIYGSVTLKTWVKSAPGGVLRFSQYRAIVENLEFAISEDQFNALKNGETYCLYYAPRSVMILSVEKPAEA